LAVGSAKPSATRHSGLSAFRAGIEILWLSRLSECKSSRGVGILFDPRPWIAKALARRQGADEARIDRYARELTDKLEQAALAALKDRKPATLSRGHN
jgi:hypothetical protein